MQEIKSPSFSSMCRFFSRLAMCLLLLGVLTSCESRRTIVNGLDEKDANEILVFLSGRGVTATKVPAEGGGGGGAAKEALWNISVPEEQATEAMALLNQVGLPRRRGQNLLGIFSNVGLVPSGLEQKIKYQAGLAKQIAHTIRKIDGVLDAEVQISFPEEDPLNPTAPKQKTTASVYVKHSGILDDPNAHLGTRIRRLVAGSVPGLDYDNVTVIGDRARFVEPISGGGEEISFVHIWSLIVASESITRFRIIFFSFIFTIFLLLFLAFWLLWKFWHVLKQSGGIKQLLNIHQVRPEELSVTAAPPATDVEEKPEEKKEKTEESETAGKGIDET